jgi:integrase
VRRNAAQLAHAPHIDAPDPMVLSPTEALAMIDALEDPGLRRLATVAAFCGLRQSEQLALTWGDVDFGARKLHVRRGLHRIAGSYQVTEVKSGSSKRVVALTDPALEALRDEQQAQREAYIAAGPKWRQPFPELKLCFTTDRGQPRSGTAVTHAFQQALAKAGLPPMRWHDLRAVYGALLLQAGTDISIVSKMLGHSAVGVTSRHYAGVGEALGRQASDRLGELLRRPAAPAN